MGFFILLRVFVRLVIVFATQSKLAGAVLLPKGVDISIKYFSSHSNPRNFLSDSAQGINLFIVWSSDSGCEHRFRIL